MVLTRYESSALNLILDDYEAPNTIANNVAQDLGHFVAEQEVMEALTALTIRGLATAFSYDPSSQSFCVINVEEIKETNNLWFMASSSGRAAVRGDHE
jgi:hypothetical protein